MIILSGVLVVVAIALLVAGIVAGNGESAQVLGLDALVVIYISIAVSVVSALCLAIGVFLRRREIFGSGGAASPARKGTRPAKSKTRKKTERPASTAGRAKGTAPAAPKGAVAAESGEVEIPSPPARVPDDAVVFVVRGRKRYHLDTCRQLAGRDREELTYAEAKEEGFSPCTACMPDTALAARASVSVGAGQAAEPAEGAEPGTPGASGIGGQDTPGTAGTAGPDPAKTAELPASGEPRAAAGRRAGTAPLTKAPADPPSGPLAESRTPGAEPGTGPGAGAASASASETGPSGSSRGTVPSAWPAPGSTTQGTATEPAATEPAATGDPAATPTAPHPRTPEDVPPGAAPAGAGDDAPAGRPGAERDPAAADEDEDEDDGVQVRILSGTKRYHRVDCALIEDIGDETDDLESLSRAEAKARGCTPCLVCQPDRERAHD
ncbi:hypothetical protein GCM10023085_68870 [Actinomadura viridis]|uniref:Methylphosphotriester-DNA--protein-cysteine methyltransferase n=1 Tax=Actinomadura viridis TaxID=58110 RepID=A0A931DK04_9ACTN|nr:hypothetical protein [Actinomadura viridis]MBG6088425.1 methylphosphotriester-DNA--protein-cysteine methyltransferase [Actinomadura viridis]